jgi:hypothetical protein
MLKVFWAQQEAGRLIGFSIKSLVVPNAAAWLVPGLLLPLHSF